MMWKQTTTTTTTPQPANDNGPRLLSKKQAAEYCGVCRATFDKWVRAGVVPEAVSITNRWDRRAIDAAIDKRSGLAPTAQESALEKWERQKREKAASGR